MPGCTLNPRAPLAMTQDIVTLGLSLAPSMVVPRVADGRPPGPGPLWVNRCGCQVQSQCLSSPLSSCGTVCWVGAQACEPMSHPEILPSQNGVAGHGRR